MSKLKIQNMSGGSVGSYDFDDGLLEFEKGSQAVHESVVAVMAARRAGSASTLSKGEVSGSNKKPWKQKGLGRARAGYRQSPVWRGGGIAFGPKPRSYDKKVNKKVAKLAFRRAFSEAVKNEKIRVLDSLYLEAPKTNLFMALMKSLEVSAPVLFVDTDVNEKVYLSARNIQGVELVSASEVGVYQLLRYPVIVITKAGLDVVRARMAGEAVCDIKSDKTTDANVDGSSGEVSE